MDIKYCKATCWKSLSYSWVRKSISLPTDSSWCVWLPLVSELGNAAYNKWESQAVAQYETGDCKCNIKRSPDLWWAERTTINCLNMKVFYVDTSNNRLTIVSWTCGTQIMLYIFTRHRPLKMGSVSGDFLKSFIKESWVLSVIQIIVIFSYCVWMFFVLNKMLQAEFLYLCISFSESIQEKKIKKLAFP